MRALGLIAAATLAACAPDLRDEFPFDGVLPDGNRLTVESRDGALLMTVNATEKNAYVYVDLDEAKEIPGDQAIGTAEWDLAFQRFQIISNSGVSGVGEVAVAILPNADFAALTTAPAEGYLIDAPDGDDSNKEVDSAFLVGDGWYEYSLRTHRLAARPIVYVVRTPEAHFKLRLLDYYDFAGTGGNVSLEVAPIAAP